MITVKISGFKKITDTDKKKLNMPDAGELNRRITPAPRYFFPTGKDGLILGLDDVLNLEAEGVEESINETSELFPNIKDKDLDYLTLPDWSLDDFLTRIPEWINFRMKDLIGNEVKFEVKGLNAGGGSVSEHVRTKIDELSAKIPKKNRRQAYILYSNASDGSVYIGAWTQIGVFYAIMSLIQGIIPVNESGNGTDRSLFIPGAIIYDYPEYLFRGLVDDISRGQRPTLDNFKKFIRFLALTKQNFYVMYMEDIVKFDKYPQIGKNRGALTKEELKEIQEYAKEWFVTVIPAFELLGHMENMLLDPDLMKYAEFPGAQCINVADPAAREFVRDLIRELAPVFETKMFAPICDESFDFGLRRSREYVEKVGFGPALAEWYDFLIKELQKVGKKLVLFAHDILIKDHYVMDAIKDKNVIVYYWKYNDKKSHPQITKLRKHGLTVVGGPAVFDWSRHYPYFDFAEKNTIYMAKEGIKRGLVGIITTKWGDFFNENFRENIYYGLAVNGQASWDPFGTNLDDLRKAFVWNFFGTEDQRLWEYMKILSDQNKFLPRWPNGMFNRFWYDPFVRKIKKGEYDIAERFIKESIYVLEGINTLRNADTVKIESANLDYIEFAARMARHYGIKILLSEAVFHEDPLLIDRIRNVIDIFSQNAGYGGEEDLPSYHPEWYSGFNWLHNDILELASRYGELWKRAAIKEGLEYPLMRFERLNWYYERAMDAIKRGKKPGMLQLNSHWIWIGGLRTNIEWGNGRYYYFLKAFPLERKKIKRAVIQGIANNEANIYLGGEYVGTVYSRFALSQLPMAKAVEWFDVTDLANKLADNIGDGAKCVLAIKAINWAYGQGGVNLILHIEYEDGKIRDIRTDKSWYYLERAPEEWPEISAEKIVSKSIRGLKRVKSLGAPPRGNMMGPISMPDWDRNMKSTITFIFGNLNFAETALRIQLGPGVYRRLFWLVKPLARFFSPDMYIMRKNPLE